MCNIPWITTVIAVAIWTNLFPQNAPRDYVFPSGTPLRAALERIAEDGGFRLALDPNVKGTFQVSLKQVVPVDAFFLGKRSRGATASPLMKGLPRTCWTC